MCFYNDHIYLYMSSTNYLVVLCVSDHLSDKVRESNTCIIFLKCLINSSICTFYLHYRSFTYRTSRSTVYRPVTADRAEDGPSDSPFEGSSNEMCYKEIKEIVPR